MMWFAYISSCFANMLRRLRPTAKSHFVNPKRIMHEGKLLRSEVINRNGEQFYAEKVAFKDWHISLHSFYLISDRLCDGRHIVEQSWDYNDFCNITIRLDDCTYALVRQVECIALVRSFRSMPIGEFDNIARPLIM